VSRRTTLFWFALLAWQWIWLLGLGDYPLLLPLLASLPLLGSAIALHHWGARARMPSALLALPYFALGVMEAYATPQNPLGPWGEIVFSLGFFLQIAHEIKQKTVS